MADNVRSILAADFGSVYTRAVLIDIVDGEYRLVARSEGRTTDGFPVYDMALGFDRIVRELADSTGRRLADSAGRITTPENTNREGVDLFALSASIGRPLRAVVIGLMPSVSIQSAIRATTGTYIDVRAVISVDQDRTEEDKLNAILLSYPDVIFLTGGTDGGASEAVMRNARLAQFAVRLIDETRRPTLIFSGNQALATRIHEMFEPLTTVFIADNLRPDIERERLEAARYQLGRAFDRYKETRQKSLASVAERSQTGIISSANGQTIVAEYLSKAGDTDVAIIDAGSGAFSVAVAEKGRVYSSIRTDIGLGHSAPQALETIGADAIRRWLPFIAGDSDLKNYAMNKSLRPGSIPMTLRESYLEHAFLRAGMRRVLVEANPDWAERPLTTSWAIACGSALTRTGSAGYDALLILDCLQPDGVTVLESDPFGLIPAMGAIAGDVPAAVVQLLEGGNLTRLGIAFSGAGQPRYGKPAMKITIKPQAAQAPRIKMTVDGGRLGVYPLPAGEYATVTVSCRGGLRINGKRRVKLTVEGGALGLLFDARGRALSAGDTPQTRAERLPYWVADVTDDPPHEVPERWLKPPDAPAASDDDSDSATADGKRRWWRRRKADESAKPTTEEDRIADVLGNKDGDEQDELGDLRNVLS
ncbi:MAG: hypothetical protein EA396_12090 [Anaerolineaceae bacterium]|nr:MAG: hypothetical protein EA396_12090 [Anaerolineaceae bacterium]